MIVKLKPIIYIHTMKNKGIRVWGWDIKGECALTFRTTCMFLPHPFFGKIKTYNLYSYNEKRCHMIWGGTSRGYVPNFQNYVYSPTPFFFGKIFRSS